MHSSIHRVIFLLVTALFLQGCSAVRLGYGNADSLARWWIDQYLDLSPEQDALTRERLARLTAWHRKTQLPDYVTLLRQGKAFAAGQPTTNEALMLSDNIIRRVRVLAEQATPDLADLLVTLTPAQIDRMAARFAEKNVDLAKEIRLAEGDAAQHKARYKRLLERAEYWLGDFSDAQENALRRMVEARDPGGQFWYEERLRRQRELLDLMRQVHRERPPRERIIALLRDYTARFDLPPDPVKLQRALAMRRASAELTVAILAMATPAQRAHAGQKFDDLIHDFTELSKAE
jgi:Family of unknown function (DUF6279)